MPTRVSGGCVSRVEFSAGIRQGYPVAPCVPPETEADPVQRLLCQLNLAFDGLLVMFRYFNFVRCPCINFCDSVTLISASVIIIIIIMPVIYVLRSLRKKETGFSIVA